MWLYNFALHEYFKAYFNSSIYRSVDVPYLCPNHFQRVVSPPAKLHKSAVKVVHAFCLCVCQSSPRYPSSPFGLFRGALMPTLKKKKRKEAGKHFLLDLSHSSRFLCAVQTLYCWMCSNSLPEQHQYFLVDSIFCCGTRAHPVIRGVGVLSQWDVLKALIAMNSHTTMQNMTKSMTSAAFQSRLCFGTFCPWFMLDLLKREMSEVEETTVGRPGLCTFTWMCLVLCRRDVGPHPLWTVRAGSKHSREWFRKAEL